jgi:PucR C-terminal helix-turn-helix domain
MKKVDKTGEPGHAVALPEPERDKSVVEARLRHLAADTFGDRLELGNRIVDELVARVPVVPSLTEAQLSDAHRTVHHTLATIFDLTLVGAPRAALADRVSEVATLWARARLPLERMILAHEITVEVLLDEAARRLPKDADHDATISLLARRLMKFLQVVTAAVAQGYRQVAEASRDANRLRDQQSFLDALIAGKRDPTLEGRAAAFGIDVGFRWVTATASKRHAGESFGEHTPNVTDAVLLGLADELRENYRTALVGRYDDRVVLLSVDRPESVPFPVGMAEIDPALGAGAIQAALSYAIRSAELAGQLGLGHVDDARAAPLRALLELPSGERERFLHGQLGTLLQHARADELLDTLAAFYSHNMVRRATAAALCVHRHTLDYRLSRIAGLIGADLEEAAVRFQNEIALFLLGLFPLRADHRVRPVPA